MKNQLKDKISKHQTEVINTKQFQQELKYLSDFSLDAIQTVQAVSFYSTRAKSIYDNMLTIRSSDDLIQSILGIRSLIVNGVHNMPRREIRFLIEMITKYLIVDQKKVGEGIKIKTQYLANNIPNSSIDIIDLLSTPFNASIEHEFKTEIKDIFYNACAYVHPSNLQIDIQIENYNKGINIGFETAKMLSDVNDLIFRVYDIILTMLFICLGQSMSVDIFIELFNQKTKWKFHNGKYIKHYSKILDFKS